MTRDMTPDNSTVLSLEDRLAEMEHLKPRLIALSLLGSVTLLAALLDGGGHAAERRVLCASFSLLAALIVFWYRGRYRDVAGL